MCFELVELYLENSLFLLKASVCNRQDKCTESTGESLVFTPLVHREKSLGIFAFYFNLHACVFTYSHTLKGARVS